PLTVGAKCQRVVVGAVVAEQAEILWDRRRVPDLDGSVGTGRNQTLAAGMENQVTYAIRVSPEGKQLQAGRCVPDFRGAVVTGRGEVFTIGAEGDSLDQADVAWQAPALVARGGFPDVHHATVSSGQVLAIRAERQARGRPGRHLESTQRLVGGGVADLHFTGD